MFYEGRAAHGLPHDPFKALIAPRPIGWIGTRSRDGAANIAPYSFFNAVSDRPKILMFSASTPTDSLHNARETGVFTSSLVSRELADKMVATSVDAPHGESEFTYAELEMAEARLVDAPFVAAAWAALECRVTEIMQPKALNDELSESWVVFGEVVGVHIRDDVLTDGLVDMAKAAPVARLGYMDYSVTAETFSKRRPKWNEQGQAADA
ncbi:flavin reductase family protein [Pseudohoeflea coraliihabitans]|uniref:Flavin reductase family protein n=1 Tax=Pseudohoeflea coraliihabitans TaxID=2860393 RepID=A0ABS6WQH6_9HYPH|nr:flavin reductase family protein [Pseudohoeflea sp. DP4N28-3]MBW3098224.1 flavin reductase family protein [Pseudohoeflea sp. DP4N28-3]